MDRREASHKIGEALEQWVNSLPDETEGQETGILGDWLAVVCMVDVGPDGQPRAGYYLAMRDGAMLPHIAEGLLQRGLQEAANNQEQV